MWDPGAYLDFSAERGRPFEDLIARVGVERHLRPGGWFALQVPGSRHDRLHELLDGLARSPRWATRLAETAQIRDAVPDPIAYAALLHSAYPRLDWGRPLPFRRVFAVAHKVVPS
jgi:trans-aconitate methyltransferase